MVQRPACGSQVADPRFNSDARVKQPGHDNDGDVTQHSRGTFAPDPTPWQWHGSRPRLADEMRPSKSRPEQGLIKLRTATLNQDDEPVLVHVVNLVVLRRTAVVKTSGS